MTKKVLVDNKITERMQLLSIEISSRKELIGFMLSNGMDINTPQFKEYNQEYENFYAEYDSLKTKIQDEYIFTDTDCNNKQIHWNLNFETCELTYEY